MAASAKMNMIIAGDGHTNIQHEDSLTLNSTNWSSNIPDCDLILTNPPFGTSEIDSLSNDDWKQFDIKSGKGQYLFLQKMVDSLKVGGEICTVIDEGVLNTESAKRLRKWLLQKCKLKAVFNLPSETFKPNKINVKSSLLYFEKRSVSDNDFEDCYKVTVCKLDTLGYYGSGDKIRGFDLDKFLNEISTETLNYSNGDCRSGYYWKSFDVSISDIIEDGTFRFDYKYWNTEIRKKINEIRVDGKEISKLNKIKTSRGKSPSASNYVDKEDGYALVIKAGSNISKQGKIVLSGADWIEKSIYDEFIEKSKESGENINLIRKGDVLLSSTGDGTLGKSCVFDLEIPAIADGHVTIIRIDHNEIDPYYLRDYLRLGFGSIQVNRLFTGSTGMIELTPDHVDSIIVNMRSNIKEQKKLSKKLRKIEDKYMETLKQAEEIHEEALTVLME
ncbi:MAG: N-6 DNA methylase [Proteobacteria bacterium]|nr:N-6 DNA methylase [Pseudomonadota bacterium]